MHLDRCPTTGDEVGVPVTEVLVDFDHDLVVWPCPCGGEHRTQTIPDRLLAIVFGRPS